MVASTAKIVAAVKNEAVKQEKARLQQTNFVFKGRKISIEGLKEWLEGTHRKHQLTDESVIAKMQVCKAKKIRNGDPCLRPLDFNAQHVECFGFLQNIETCFDVYFKTTGGKNRLP